jgi:putative pyruvate formate lyase activating enzyme
MAGMTSPLNRAVTRDEYRQLVDYAIRLGLKNGFTQEFGTAKESFIPHFDGSGVL